MSDFPSSMKPVRFLAISGSLRRASTNTAALEALAKLAPEGVKVLVYRDLATLPPFNPDDDIEDKPKPEPVATLRALVDASDALIIAAPEYAHGLPGALKNALDWLVARPSPASPPRSSTPRLARFMLRRPCARSCPRWPRASRRKRSC
jgi:NAD(P)H-dependent FMN reductase